MIFVLFVSLISVVNGAIYFRIERLSRIGNGEQSVTGLSKIGFECFNIDGVVFPLFDRLKVYVNCEDFYDTIGNITFPFCSYIMFISGPTGKSNVGHIAGCFNTQYNDNITKYDATRTLLVSDDVYELTSWNVIGENVSPVIHFYSATPIQYLVTMMVLNKTSDCYYIRPLILFDKVLYLNVGSIHIPMNRDGTFSLCMENVTQLAFVSVTGYRISFTNFDANRVHEIFQSSTKLPDLSTDKEDPQWSPMRCVHCDKKTIDYSVYDKKYDWKATLYKNGIDQEGVQFPLAFKGGMNLGYKTVTPFLIKRFFKAVDAYFVVNREYNYLVGGIVNKVKNDELFRKCELKYSEKTVGEFNSSMCSTNTTSCKVCGGTIDCVILHHVMFLTGTRCGNINNLFYYNFEEGTVIVDVISIFLVYQKGIEDHEMCSQNSHKCNGMECTPPKLLNGSTHCVPHCGTCRSGFSCNNEGKCIQNKR